MQEYILLTDSASEPVSLSEAKTHLRIDTNDYDNILTPLIKTARNLAEEYTARDFINKTWELYLDCFQNGLEIEKTKLQSITSIQYLSNGTLTTLDSSKYYFTKSSNYSKIYLKDSEIFPSHDNIRQAIKITFVSGYGTTASNVPQGLKTLLLQHIAYLFENAGDCSDTSEIYNNYLPYTAPKKIFDII
jgi:uncharacterized phiE125 gp8 family phage protein